MVYRFLLTLTSKPLKRLKIADDLFPRLKPWAKLKNNLTGNSKGFVIRRLAQIYSDADQRRLNMN